MHFSYNKKSLIRLWWRRQILHRRHLSLVQLILIFLCIIYLLIIIPNPFSAQYNRIPVDQDVDWDDVSQLLTIKEQVLFNNTLPNSIKVIKRGTDKPELTSSVLIVLYTTVFRDKKFCSFSIDHIFGKTCPSKNRCQWSCDQTKYREADALIFHAYDISPNSMPDRSETKPNSVWILWSDEPPSIINYEPLKSYKFNWTISYKLTSEVSIATYGLFSKLKSPLSEDEYNDWIEKQFSRRIHGALWFVSNCNAKKRLNLFKNLKSSSKILIEGYGRCVDYYPLHLCGSYSQCEYDYTSNFKFYLSFESNTCQDYITEKFYKPFYYGLIPIVYGPDKNNYDRLAPANSFLHIDDFNKDMTKLANYIEDIHSNLTLFSLFHQWRKNYEIIIDGRALERIRMCELCQRLINLRQGQTIYYEDIAQFYNEKCNYT